MVLVASILSLFGCGSKDPGIPEGDTIVYFSYRRGGGMARFSGFRYEIKANKDGKVHFLFNEGYPDESEYELEDHSVFDSLDKVVRTYEMWNYQPNYQPPMQIFDGESWDLYIKYASGATIQSGGYMAGPDNWGDASSALYKCLKPWKEMPGMVKEVVRFKYTYGTSTYLVERQGDHALLTVDVPSEERHETYEKGLEMLEELRIVANVEGLKKNGSMKSDDPTSTPFTVELEYSNGDKYFYESYDLNYQCHDTEVLQWFFSKWGDKE